MKNLFRFAVVLAFTFASWTASADQPVNVEESVKKMAKEFENTAGVESMVLDGGLGLALVKGMFKAKFGKEFMKDVTSMVIIEYSKASNEVVETIRKRLDSFSGTLQELKLNSSDMEKGQYMKCYAKIEDIRVSDMMLIIEDKESRLYLYMGGKLNMEKLMLQK